MRTSRLVIRAFTYYRRTNAAVVLGVATAVAVLGGALLVGDSVRGSLRDLVLHRLGRTDQIVAVDGILPRSAGRRVFAPTERSPGRSRDCPDDRRRRRGRRPGERPARVARRRLRRGRALLAFSRRRRVRLGQRRRAARGAGQRGTRQGHRRHIGRHRAGPRGAAVRRADRVAAGAKRRPGPDAAAFRSSDRRAGRSGRVLAAAATGQRARRVRPSSAASTGAGARRPREHAARFDTAPADCRGRRSPACTRPSR